MLKKFQERTLSSTFVIENEIVFGRRLR